jgi:hypothetical protein
MPENTEEPAALTDPLDLMSAPQAVAAESAAGPLSDQGFRGPITSADQNATDATASAEALNRRRILGAALGVAGAGLVGGSVLVETFASPAMATTLEAGALAPAVVILTDAPTIAVNASLGNDFRVTLNGNRTMGNPSNPVNGEQILFQITQGAGGSFTIAWGGAYDFSGALPQPTLSTAAGKTDLLGFIYNAARSSWLLVAYLNGFS